MEISDRSRLSARKAGSLGDGLKDFAQQRRHDLENSYPLARYLLHEERGVPRLFVGTDMDARAYHEGRKKLPDGDDEALGRCLSDHVRRPTIRGPAILERRWLNMPRCSIMAPFGTPVEPEV